MIKISDLPAATSLTGAEIVPIVQGGTTSQTTAQAVADLTNVAAIVHAATGKTTPVDADELALADSAASYGLKKLTWANLKATLKTYFDTLYQPLAEILTQLSAIASAQGDILYYNGTAWVKLAAGTSGYFLKTLGAGANPAWAANASVFTKSYDSSVQTITAAGALTLPHSLGTTPLIVQCLLKCTDAGGEIGYAQNDYVFINTTSYDGGSSSANTGVSIVPDATNLNIRFGAATPTFYINNKTTGVLQNITNSKWAFIVRAYA